MKDILSEYNPPPDQLEGMKETGNKVRKAMDAWGYKPNNSQLGVAMAEVFLHMKGLSKLNNWEYPAGYGKSRIEMAIILGVCYRGSKGKKIVVVFHNDEVRKQDKKIFEEMKNGILEGEPIQIHLVCGL